MNVDYPVVSCIPKDEWRQDQLRMFAPPALARTLQVYEGSIEKQCSRCDCVVMVGPRQQGTMAQMDAFGAKYMVTCMLCSVQLAIESGVEEDEDIAVINLGNRHPHE